MTDKDMDNIVTVKVNAYEIAKAPDVDFGYKSVLDHFSILVDRLFNYHTPEVTDTLFFNNDGIGKLRKDFIIGGGLVAAGNAMLAPLPIVAYSHTAGVFFTNGLDVDNRPIQIQLGEDFYTEGYRIESIYIGSAETDDTIYDNDITEKHKKDPQWDEYQYEWRASYQVGRDGIDTPFREFKKRQMQAVRFYVYPGVVEMEKKHAIAAIPDSVGNIFSKRVKIAEVLVHCTLDGGNVPHIQPIAPDDVRFVTATQYWDDECGKSAIDADAHWLQFALPAEPNITAGMTMEQRKAEEQRATRLTENRKAYRAEHYNYRWTSEKTRTYKLGSIAEISERFFKIHQADGTLKEAVVWRKHINLNPDDREALTGENIPITYSQRPNFNMPYGAVLKPYESIKTGLERIIDACLQNRIKIDNHIADTKPHGATDSARGGSLAWRDYSGRMEAEDPVRGKQVLNYRYLHDTFAPKFESLIMDKVMVILTSAIIRTQKEFDDWIAQKNNEAFESVFLFGEFEITNKDKYVKLAEIGTKQVTGLKKAIIKINFTPIFKYNFAFDGGGAQIKDVTVVATGFYDGYTSDPNNCFTITGFKNCVCENCTAKVTGKDYGTINEKTDLKLKYYGITNEKTSKNIEDYKFATMTKHGASAIGFQDCTVKNCRAIVKGGDGRYGTDGDHAELFQNATDGGDGGNGGNAVSFKNCTIIGSQYEMVIAGNAGNGGVGGQTAIGRSCSSGDGGDGGNAYVLSYSSGTAGKGGKGGPKVWNHNKSEDYYGYAGRDGKDGQVKSAR